MTKLVIGLLMAWLIWKVLSGVIRMLAVEPDAPDPDEVVPALEFFRCTVCGSEVTMTVRSLTESAPPRHCREPMHQL